MYVADEIKGTQREKQGRVVVLSSNVYNICVIHNMGYKWKNSAIKNCLIITRGAIKLHCYSTSAQNVEFPPNSPSFLYVLSII